MRISDWSSDVCSSDLPGRLAAVGLTLEQVRTALVAATTDAAKGTIDTPTTSFAIAANDQIVQAQPFEDVVLAYKHGAPIRVRDIGRAVAAAADRNAAAYYNNKPAPPPTVYKTPDRKSAVSGKSVDVRVNHGGGAITK